MSPLWLQVNDFFYSYSYHVEICHSTIIISGGFRLWRLVMYFCVNNCTSPSNDYTAVECSNNNQAQLHTHVSVPYCSPDDWLGLELLWDIQFGLQRDESGRGNPKIFGHASRASGWTPLSKFLNPPLNTTNNPYVMPPTLPLCHNCCTQKRLGQYVSMQLVIWHYT